MFDWLVGNHGNFLFIFQHFVAELFQVEGMYTDSLLACIKEAYLLAPSSPHVLTQVCVTSGVRWFKSSYFPQLGRILEGSGHYTEAGTYYSHAIARDPSFAPAMAHRVSYFRLYACVYIEIATEH